ncbi:MAG TPA: alpha-hydroxy-acid oxidizing protein [Puia sp.]|nr:alpha-hydroxy-acid oxidizing protein [Puia sp.]
MSLIRALDRQRTIFLQGISGRRPLIPFQAAALRALARKKMSPRAWAYIDGGAGNEESIQSNTTAFTAVKIRPRMMHPNDTADLSSSLFGMTLPFPLLLAPIGVLDLICRSADRLVARQCRETNIPFIFSNQAGTPMEVCAGDMGETPRWFQLYWSRSDAVVLSFVRRAEACGCQAIVLTVDTTLLGWRSRDLALGYLPFLSGMGIAQYTSDPVFLELLRKGGGRDGIAGPRPAITPSTIATMLRLKQNYPGGLWKNIRSKEPLEAVRFFINTYSNPALSWDKLEWLREQTRLPILIKGILRADDAIRARASGADGIIVSNHGGRQVDGAISTLQALVQIRRSLPRPFPVLLDSGIRSGSDMFKALALGADAVLVGRPYAYGLAIDRNNGVKEVVRNLLNEFELTARLAGCRTLAEIGPDMVECGPSV